MTFSHASMRKENVDAWDALYGSTTGPVWGSSSVGFLEEFVEMIRPELTGARILDAGAGEGRNLPALRGLAGLVMACDGSSHALSKLAEQHKADVAGIVRCALEDLPFQAGSFDMVLLSDVMETLPGPEHALRSIYAVLRPGGLLLCNIPDMDDGVAGVEMTDAPNGAYYYRGRYYYVFRSEDDAVHLLRECGFRDVARRTCRWRESPHPMFRQAEHEHVSRVFLLRKAEE